MAQIIVETDYGERIQSWQIEKSPDNPQFDTPIWNAINDALRREKEKGLR